MYIKINPTKPSITIFEIVIALSITSSAKKTTPKRHYLHTRKGDNMCNWLLVFSRCRKRNRFPAAGWWVQLRKKCDQIFSKIISSTRVACNSPDDPKELI